jgi:trans-aconitate methyltransferase
MQGDARALPFTDQFDKVTAMLAMNWVNEQEQAFDSLFSALKAGGKAIITRPGKKPTNLGVIAEQLIKTDRWAHFFPDYKQTKHYYDAQEYTQLLEATGFEIEGIQEDSTYTKFKDREALFGFYRPLCNFMFHLSDELQTLFLEELIDRVLSYEPPLADGSIQLFDLKLEVIVSKPPKE